MTIDPNVALAVAGLAVAAIVFVIRLEGRVQRTNDRILNHERICAERQKRIRGDLRLLKQYLLPAHVVDEHESEEEQTA